jgi:hypothetical protein
VRKAATRPQVVQPLGEASAKTGHAAFIAVLVVLAFLAIVRLRVLDVPLERDEGEYAYSGQLILQGIPPYQLAYNMKFPGTYYAYSVILALFGQTASGIHFGLLLVNAATIVILFFLARRLLADAFGAAVAATAFGFLSVDLWIMGVFAHATHFVLLAALAGLLLVFRALDSGKVAHFVIAGVLLGLSVLMKQNGIFFLALGLGIVAWTGLYRKRSGAGAAVYQTALVAAGSAIPFAILCLLLLTQGVFGKFVFWTFQYAKEYVSEKTLGDAWQLFRGTLNSISRSDRLIWFLGAAGLVMLWLVRWTADKRVVLTAFLVASFIAICPGFYFREHYFILLLPAVAVFAGVAVLSTQRVLSRRFSGGVARALALGVFAVAIDAHILNGWDYFFNIPTLQMNRMRYGPNPFLEAPEIAKYIQSKSNPEDRIAVLGSEPEIYFDAKRKSATGYIYTYALMEQQKYSPRMQDEMIKEVTTAHPKYIVFVSVFTSWMARNPQEKILTWSNAYINRCYDIVGVADILSANKTIYLWDAQVAAYHPQSQYVVYTFRSKSDAPCAVPY